MAKSKGDKYKNPLTNFRVPYKDRRLPSPSLEDIHDSKKTEFFTAGNKDNDI